MMGLDTTHDCWHGAYSAFNRWRVAIARLVGINLDTMEGFTAPGIGIQWDVLKPDPLHILLNHSDCDGEIAAEDCAAIADRLETLLPKLAELPEDGGHIGNWAQKTQAFIDGLREAVREGEPVKFC